MKYTALFFSILLLVFIDQFVKYIIRAKGGFYICNAGLAFGIKIALDIFYFLLIIIAIAIIYFAKRNWKLVISNLENGAGDSPLITIYHLLITNKIPLALILAGAISNILDRILYGCVIDFIDLHFWPVFNLADVYITIGAFAVIIKLMQIKTTDSH